jgi:molecular chaperone Hsp33
MMLMSTATPDELVSPALSPLDLLYRLFHEEEVRVYPPMDIADQCRCSRERVEGVLRTLPEEDIGDITRDGPAEIRCEFCSRAYHFTAEEILTLKQKRGSSEDGDDEGDTPVPPRALH